MDKKIKKIITVSLKVIVSVGFLVLVIYKTNWLDVYQNLRTINAWWLVLYTILITKPFPPSITSSLVPPVLVASKGSPEARASSIVLLIPSLSEGNTKTEDREYIFGNSS